MYFIEENGTIVKNTYESKGAVAKFLSVQHRILTNHMDKWIKGGIKGNYIFSYELNDIEIEKLIETSEFRKYNNCRIWVYNASTLELL